MRKRGFFEKKSSMDFKENARKQSEKRSRTFRDKTICVHTFSDLSHISPVVFLYLLKECYTHGTFKATVKFRALQQQVFFALLNSPQPGAAAILILQCLYILPIFELYSEGLSHLILSAFGRFQKAATISVVPFEAKKLAARLFIDAVERSVNHVERIIVKIVDIFDVRMTDVEEFASSERDFRYETAEVFIELYIAGLIESKSYMTAVTLLEHFSIRQLGQSFLSKMIENKEHAAAEKWATFMGKPVLSVLVREYADRNMLNNAYVAIKNNNLQQDFPDLYHKGKESNIKKLAEKGVWDVAEAKAKGDRRLLEYLVYLALEAGYSEKVDELSKRYSLEGFLKGKECEAVILQSHYLSLSDLGVEDVMWVDDFGTLRNATCQIEGAKVIGLDCEWKPNFRKGCQSKVSILQVASEKMVFIFDLIKLYRDVPDALDKSLAQLLQSPRILKLGYSFQCDMKQLIQSYGDLACFKHCEMLLDVQKMFKESRGGLSGLAEKILGAGLNKTRRNSNWEQRPLSRNQLEYAALDAVVLIHIFRHVNSHSQSPDVSDGHEKVEWKSHIVSHMENSAKKSKKEPKTKKNWLKPEETRDHTT